jgi:2,4-dienoyl-CoA reductase-like NADH-dependent reductase (Old Yellow Enzyme family)
VKVAVQIAESLKAEELKPADLTIDEILKIIDNFVKATLRAREAGFDAVEFHAAHHYTLADFISKKTNTRRDNFGKNFEGRMKILLEIIAKSKEKVGNDYTIICRINGDEFIVGGNTLKDAQFIAKRLEEIGIHAIDVSCNGKWDEGIDAYSANRICPTKEWPNGANIHLSEGIKKVVRIPVIGGGLISHPEIAETILEENKCDLVYLGRPLFRDPYWPIKAKEGRWGEILECKFCNFCLKLLRSNKKVECKYRSKGRQNTN